MTPSRYCKWGWIEFADTSAQVVAGVVVLIQAWRNSTNNLTSDLWGYALAVGIVGGLFAVVASLLLRNPYGAKELFQTKAGPVMHPSRARSSCPTPHSRSLGGAGGTSPLLLRCGGPLRCCYVAATPGGSSFLCLFNPHRTPFRPPPSALRTASPSSRPSQATPNGLLALFLFVWWSVATGILTVMHPCPGAYGISGVDPGCNRFTLTGNGYFALWAGCGCSIVGLGLSSTKFKVGVAVGVTVSVAAGVTVGVTVGCSSTNVRRCAVGPDAAQLLRLPARPGVRLNSDASYGAHSAQHTVFTPSPHRTFPSIRQHPPTSANFRPVPLGSAGGRFEWHGDRPGLRRVCPDPDCRDCAQHAHPVRRCPR